MTEKLRKFVILLQSALIYNFKIWIGVAIIIVVALCVWLFTREADVGTQQAADEIVTLSNNIRRYYQNRPDFWGLSTNTVIKNKLYPQKMLQKEQLIGFFGNQILVGNGENAEVLMPGARGVDIIYKGLNKKQCEELASHKFDEKFWFGVTGVTIINGSNLQYFTWSDKEFALPIKKDLAKNICKSSSTLMWHCE